MNDRLLAVVGLGAGGHAKVVIEILLLDGRYQLVGLLDPNSDLHNRRVANMPVLGADSLLAELFQRGICHFFVGVGSVGHVSVRKDLFLMAVALGMSPVNAIHPRSIISQSARIGRGITVMAGAIINPDSSLGENVIINSGSIVEHDCQVGDHVHVATGARLSGGVVIGAGAHIGAGATIRQCISIGDHAVVGAGAAVVKDVPPHAVVTGVPAQIVVPHA